MRLSDLLSKKPIKDFQEVDYFLLGKKGFLGQKVKLPNIQVCQNFYCESCKESRTFISEGDLTCIFTNKKLISIDSVLHCQDNNQKEVQAWYLVEALDNITSSKPKVRILKRDFKFPEGVYYNYLKYGNMSKLLSMADKAYEDFLGSGAIVYLRKILEIITIDTAEKFNIETKRKGKNKNFKEVFRDVEEKCKIIPEAFSKNGYKLFSDLSNVIHGESDEEENLKKYSSFRRLVVGILDNIKNKKEFEDASKNLGWNEEVIK